MRDALVLLWAVSLPVAAGAVVAAEATAPRQDVAPVALPQDMAPAALPQDVAPAAPAQDMAPAPDAAPAAPGRLVQYPGVGLPQLGRVVLSLGLVLAIILVAARVMRGMRPGGAGGAGPLRIASVLPLGARERIALIDVGDRQLVVGMTATSISLLHVLDEPVAAGSEAPPAPQGAFAPLLQRLLGEHR